MGGKGGIRMISLACGLGSSIKYPAHFYICLFAILCLTQPGFSQATEFSLWLQQVKTEAVKRGIKQDVIDSALAGVRPIKRVLKRDRNQSEFKLTLNRYLNRVVTKKNINPCLKKPKSLRSVNM